MHDIIPALRPMMKLARAFNSRKADELHEAVKRENITHFIGASQVVIHANDHNPHTTKAKSDEWERDILAPTAAKAFDCLHERKVKDNPGFERDYIEDTFYGLAENTVLAAITFKHMHRWITHMSTRLTSLKKNQWRQAMAENFRVVVSLEKILELSVEKVWSGSSNEYDDELFEENTEWNDETTDAWAYDSQLKRFRKDAIKTANMWREWCADHFWDHQPQTL